MPKPGSGFLPSVPESPCTRAFGFSGPSFQQRWLEALRLGTAFRISKNPEGYGG